MPISALTGKVFPYKAGFGTMPADVFHAPFPIDLHGVSEDDSIAALEKLGAPNALIICAELSENLFLSARNLPGVGMVDVGALDPVMIISFDHVIVTQDALTSLENQTILQMQNGAVHFPDVPAVAVSDSHEKERPDA